MENSELMRTMSMQELQETNGGVLPAVAAVFWYGFQLGVALGGALLPTIIEERK